MNTFNNVISRCINFLQYVYGTITGKSLFYKNVHKWFAMNGNTNYLTNYSLDPDAIVFEIGGYKGVFTDEIIKKFQCKLYIFEPITQYYDILVSKYKNNPKVHVYKLGLGKENGFIELGLLDDGTSAYKIGKAEKVQIKKLSEFLTENFITHIDLISINIEGGEYSLLEDIISTGSINMMKNIQIQFHDFVDNATMLRLKLIDQILFTHKRTYTFPFVWEGFERK